MIKLSQIYNEIKLYPNFKVNTNQDLKKFIEIHKKDFFEFIINKLKGNNYDEELEEIWNNIKKEWLRNPVEIWSLNNNMVKIPKKDNKTQIVINSEYDDRLHVSLYKNLENSVIFSIKVDKDNFLGVDFYWFYY